MGKYNNYDVKSHLYPNLRQSFNQIEAVRQSKIYLLFADKQNVVYLPVSLSESESASPSEVGVGGGSRRWLAMLMTGGRWVGVVCRDPLDSLDRPPTLLESSSVPTKYEHLFAPLQKQSLSA